MGTGVSTIAADPSQLAQLSNTMNAVASRGHDDTPTPITSASPSIPATVVEVKKPSKKSVTKPSSDVSSIDEDPPQLTYGQKPPKAPAAKQYVDSYNEADVLRGRGGLVNHHKGNQWFLAERDEMRTRYLACEKKQDKYSLSQELVERVSSRGGRFLAYDDSVQKWYVLPPRKARTKASQALREERKPPKKIAQSLLKLKSLQS